MSPKRRVLIDTVSLLSPYTGIGKYTYENALCMRSLAQKQWEWTYFYGYFSNELPNITSNEKSGNRFLGILLYFPLQKKILRTISSLYVRFGKKKFDLYWKPNCVPFSFINASKTIVTVHDFSFHIEPSWHPKARIEYLNNEFWKNIKKADHIITGSNYTKQEVLHYLDVSPESVDVIYHGVDHKCFRQYPVNELNVFRRLINISEQFILFVGSIEPRKNLVNLLKAYISLSHNLKKKYHLVLVGFKGWENKMVMELIKNNHKYIHYLGYLSNEALAYAYNLATLFVYPSLYEGFGIPPLEAMACGTPVVASNTTSLPETCGDAAYLLDPYDIPALAKGIEKVLTDESFANELIRKGLAHAAQFTWERSAQAHLEVFNKVT